MSIQVRSALLVFSLGGQPMALPLSELREVVALPALVRPPLRPRAIEGLFDRRGSAVPVLRLDLLLGLPPITPGAYAPVLMLRRPGGTVGLLAERSFEVAQPDMLRGMERQDSYNGCALGFFSWRDQRAVLLSSERLLATAEADLAVAFAAQAAERQALWQPEER